MVQNTSVENNITPLESTDEINRWDNRPFCGAWPESRHKKPTDIKKTIKKSKRIRTAYTTDQIRALEMIFTQNKYVNSERRREISNALNIGDKSVKIWFQNRRMKEKRESSESSSDSSNEASVCEMSPAPLPKTELLSLEQVTGQMNQDSFQWITPDTSQYPIPTMNINYQSNYQTHTASSSDNPISNNMQFYYDNTVYPTQYYPSNDNNNFNDYTYYQFQQENAMYRNYWNASNVESCYFYN